MPCPAYIMGEAAFNAAKTAASLDDPAFHKAVFAEAYEQTRLQLAGGDTGDGDEALSQIIKVRNQALNDIAAAFALEKKAECESGCASCCHQMVVCSPFEIFDIAHYLLDTKSSEETASIKLRLAQRAPLPLDVQSRQGRDKPCVLLEDNRCSIYEHRPSRCRTMLSTSRAACETSLNLKEQTVPFIAEPAVVAFLMQLGIDHALIKHWHLSTETVEMSRALLIALEQFEAAVSRWANGEEAFPDCHVGAGGPSNHDLVQRAAAQSGLL